MKKWWIFLTLLWAGAAWGDWSPEITLWDSPPEQYSGGQYGTVAVDSAEGVHIAYTYELPNHHLRLKYVKYDDHGHMQFPPILLGDSLDTGASRPRVRFFGLDSLWVVWLRTNQLPDSITGEHYRESLASLDLNGNVADTVRDWPGTPVYFSWHVPIYTTPDRKAVFCYTAEAYDDIRCVVQLPNGSRTLDHDIVWNPELQCRVNDVVHYNVDSLQLGWTQTISFGSTYVATKRVDLNTPFDSTHIGDYIQLSPVGLWAFGEFVAPPDSLLTYTLFEGFTRVLKVVHSSNYSTVAELVGSIGGDDQSVAFEPDGTISTWSPAAGPQLRFRRFSFPDLNLIEDTLFLANADGIRILGYAVSASGIRHVVYERTFGPGRIQIIYRYWRSDLSARVARSIEVAEQFTVWPNPSNGSVTVEGILSSIRSLTVYDVLGRQVLRLNVAPIGQRWQIPEISDLPSGTYFLNFETLRGSAIHKIVLDR